ncbi:hypothetical protein C8R44DRAFT_885164 [Mycena epipterygia]|nr:hypothetical protein C8R44DRAFT_885164 [Mycena epipterygia]
MRSDVGRYSGGNTTSRGSPPPSQSGWHVAIATGDPQSEVLRHHLPPVQGAVAASSPPQVAALSGVGIADHPGSPLQVAALSGVGVTDHRRHRRPRRLRRRPHRTPRSGSTTATTTPRDLALAARDRNVHVSRVHLQRPSPMSHRQIQTFPAAPRVPHPMPTIYKQ